jgi:tRNA dimethylallyltransferase
MSCVDITLIAGPTAVGKSAYAIELAQAKNGIIINADSVQIYDVLPILSAQPTADDQILAPHVLYGVLPIHQTSSVQQWLSLARNEIERAWQNNQHPIVVGGTGLYLNALAIGLSPLPDVPDDVRAQARARQKEMGNPAFHAELSRIDPVMAARLRPSDTQRLIRAYEVRVATGQSLAQWQDLPRMPPFPSARIHKILVDAPREILRTRARMRLNQMVQNGVVDEVAAFRTQPGATDSPATKALGYHAFCDYLDARAALGVAIDAAFIQTAHYIKRQQTWFRHQIVFDEIISGDKPSLAPPG